ncbi:hypothetical protein PIB30_086627 [Stylosanthes scabra]|uniref:GRF-type domain-containing protein n=1 Tax=Stylosanthes scabra TaxID=79078 RepID=A0ABU6XSI9_9FABA|nr:hypothetical protein [Stylosanthes scabra]
MHSEGVSSVLKRIVGGVSGRMERSSLSTQGVFVPNGVEDRDGVAPKCHCRVYAILYMSRTTNNPNRLFFGCRSSRMLARLSHCKFFLWLNKHTEQLAKIGAGKCAEETEDVDQHLAMVGVENRIAGLEERVAAWRSRLSLISG